uniref:Uncharacterized protein n=1 Tax=Arundo donax TaxID=35708 RepID=A0A0A9HIH6_ARUDO
MIMTATSHLSYIFLASLTLYKSLKRVGLPDHHKDCLVTVYFCSSFTK